MNKFELKPSGELSYGKERCRAWAQHGMFGHGHPSHNEIPYTGYRKNDKNIKNKSSIDGLMPIHHGNTEVLTNFVLQHFHGHFRCGETIKVGTFIQLREVEGDVPSGKLT
jgi:hypothetical protein